MNSTETVQTLFIKYDKNHKRVLGSELAQRRNNWWYFVIDGILNEKHCFGGVLADTPENRSALAAHISYQNGMSDLEDTIKQLKEKENDDYRAWQSAHYFKSSV